MLEYPTFKWSSSIWKTASYTATGKEPTISAFPRLSGRILVKKQCWIMLYLSYLSLGLKNDTYLNSSPLTDHFKRDVFDAGDSFEARVQQHPHFVFNNSNLVLEFSE